MADNSFNDLKNWLLEPENPSVRFWALQDLDGLSQTHPEIISTQKAIMDSTIVRAILNAQDPKGFWIKPDNMYLPKYTATTHSLLILAELGAKRTQAIERGIEHIFQFQRDSGHFLTGLPKSSRGRASKVIDGCCLDANILYYLIYFGYYDDPRVQRLINFLVDHHQKQEAGWKCRAFPIDSSRVFPDNCYMGATKVLRSLAAISAGQRNKRITSIIDREVENILENRIYKYLKYPDGSRKEKAGWKRFGFPLFYQSDVLEVLDTLTKLGVQDKRMQDAFDLVMKNRVKEGWLMKNSYNGKMWCNIEEKNKPSKWITLRAMRIILRYQ
jgi:hypothetical protein